MNISKYFQTECWSNGVLKKFIHQISITPLLHCSFFIFLFSIEIFSQEIDSTKSSKPFVRGGVYDKPFVTNVFSKTAIGGYMEAVWKFGREEGVTEEITFEARRFNLFAHSVISERTKFFTEIEFEHGTEEINIEFAALDFDITSFTTFRGGIILSPLGKFNLTHDAPLNELTDRPIVSTQIIPTALSEAGMGFYGSFFPSLNSRMTYELYAVNGFNDGIITNGSGTQISEGRGDVGEDNNQRPSFVGRISYAPLEQIEFGFSTHSGVYNTFSVDGLEIDDKKMLTIAAFDWEYNSEMFDLIGEFARADIDIQQSLQGLFAERQQGVYAQINYRFGKKLFSFLPLSYCTAIARYEFVYFDSQLRGDAQQKISLGINFRPTSDTVFKFDYHYDWMWSRVDVVGKAAGINFSVASYF